MLRRAVVVVAAAALLALPSPASAQQNRPRVFVLALDGTTLADWTRAAGAFERLLEGGVAVLALPPVIEDPARAALAAAETIGAGRILNDAPTADRRPTPLWIGLAAFRLEPTLLSGAPQAEPPAIARALGSLEDFDAERFAIGDAQFPGGARTNVAAMARAVTSSTADVVLAQIPDVLSVERELGAAAPARASWVAQTVTRAEAVLAAMLEAADESDLVVVISPTPAGPRRADGIAVGAIAIAGDGVPSGPLISASTSRRGLVSLTDVAPTVLAWFGFSNDDVDRGALPRFTDAPPGFAGTAIGGIEGASPEHAAALVEQDLLAAARDHPSASRSFVLAGIALALLAVGTVLSGRGAPAGDGRFPRGWRDGLATASIAVVFYAPALLLASPIPALLIAVGAAVAGRALLGRHDALRTALLTCAVLPLADVASGGSLIASSPFPTPIAGGSRVRALEPVVLGMILAGFAGIGALLDRMKDDERMPLLPLLFGVAAVFLAGTRGAGGDVGAVLALVPAGLLLALNVAGARIGRHATAGIVASTIAAAGLVTLTFGPALWVHEDPLVPQRAIPNLVSLRIGSFTEQLPTIWLAAVVLATAGPALLAVRRGALLGRGLWGRPFLRAGLLATALGAGIAVVTVRGGLATAGVAAVLLAMAMLTPLLAPERGT